MSLYEHIKGAALFAMTLFGSFGNIATILSFIQIAYQERKLLPVEIILSCLSGVNLLILLSRGIPYPLFIFGVIVSFNDPACKAVSYIHIWFRSLGVNLTCLLSCFQCITISSGSEKWVKLKGTVQNHLLSLISFLCLVSMASSVDIILFGSSGTNVTGLQNTIFNGYCLNTLPSKIVFDTINYVIFARDVAFLLLMTLSSCVILIILYKHQKRVIGIRSSEKSTKTTAEGQASKTVAIIVVMYVLFFGMGTTIWFYEAVADTKVNFLAVIPDFLSVCYSSFFPVVIIVFNKRIQNVLKDYFGKHGTKHFGDLGD
ncbi:olfactory receptor class A-like protein 1 [Protopterus annectens]|uniref:olfactory receptor class A-like protein 1 n=1 Tax=Protopterus annectens TaxID=7888 RepID=UPI001CFA8284|nr:olfactory receptor class A-like protein 1 [Protopterus annectens]